MKNEDRAYKTIPRTDRYSQWDCSITGNVRTPRGSVMMVLPLVVTREKTISSWNSQYQEFDKTGLLRIREDRPEW